MGGRIWLLAVVSKWLSNSKVASGLLSLSERPPGRRVAVAWQSHILLAYTATRKRLLIGSATILLFGGALVVWPKLGLYVYDSWRGVGYERGRQPMRPNILFGPRLRFRS